MSASGQTLPSDCVGLHDCFTPVNEHLHAVTMSSASCQQRTFCDALHYVPRNGSELGADVPEAAYVGLPLLREFERRRDMADEYAGCH
jgi:hypothetical protein